MVNRFFGSGNAVFFMEGCKVGVSYERNLDWSVGSCGNLFRNEIKVLQTADRLSAETNQFIGAGGDELLTILLLPYLKIGEAYQ